MIPRTRLQASIVVVAVACAALVAAAAAGTPPSVGTRFQTRTDGVTPIPTGGHTGDASNPADSAMVGAFFSKGGVPPAPETYEAEFEVKPVGVAFADVATHTTPFLLEDLAVDASVTVTGLVAGTSYHWQVRAVDPSTGATGSWTAYGGNAETDPDFIAGVAPPSPTLSALDQYDSGGTTSLPVGATASGSSVVFKADLSDPAGGTVRLEVEVRPLGTALIGTPTDPGSYVSSGSRGGATVSPADGSYHWQARARSIGGGLSGWTRFGSNPETAADFAMLAPSPSPSPSPSPAPPPASRDEKDRGCGASVPAQVPAPLIALLAAVAVLGLALRRTVRRVQRRAPVPAR